MRLPWTDNVFSCVIIFRRQSSYTRAYINIVPFPCVPSRRSQNYVVQHLCLSVIYEKVCEKVEKNSQICLAVINKVPTFASAFGNEGGDRLTSCFGTVLQAFGSFFLPASLSQERRRVWKKKQKKLRKVLEVIRKSPYLCIRFLKRKTS